ncbi:MAG: pilus assembly protein PilM [Phycisphaerae bacterium]|nr:pilus assembly protein PilM [Phycisphaerae bacterium]MDD5381254.1 pilus assembly protein PilM [Phycisphaerae bacterium]
MVSWKLKTRSLQPIGLDIGHNSIKMIQLVMSGEHISILAADKVHIRGMNGDEKARRSFIISAIKKMLAEGKFHGRNVVSCLPSEKLKITSLRLAETETDEIEQALKKEAGQRFGMDPEKDIINYLVAGNVQCGDEIKNELILFAASDETIRSHIAMLEEVRLRPVAIDTVPCALFRSFERSRRREEDKEQTVVFVDVGSRFTTVVFGRGGEISFTKQIPIGGEKFNSEISSKLGVSIDEAEILRGKLQMESMLRADAGLGVSQLSPPVGDNSDSIPQAEENWGGHSAEQLGRSEQSAVEVLSRSALDTSTQQVMADAIGAAAEELAKEISLCLRYYTVTFRGKHVERAVFSGGEAYERILLNVLRRHLTAKIEIAQPLKGLDILDGTKVNFDSNRRNLLCEWAVAVGLSLKGWEGQRKL